MPTIFRWKGYRFHFFSNEGTEPPHVHVRRAEGLRPTELAYNDGFSASELAEIRQVIEDRRDEFERKWHEYFA